MTTSWSLARTSARPSTSGHASGLTSGHASGPVAAQAPLAVPDAGRRVLLLIGGRLTLWFLGGAGLAVLFALPAGPDLPRWLAAVLLFGVTVAGVVTALSRPVAPGSALLFAAATATAGCVLVAVHPALSAADRQLLLGLVGSSAAAGAFLSWGPWAGTAALAGVLAFWAGPLAALGASPNPLDVVSAVAGGVTAAVAAAFLRRGFALTQRALAAAEDAVAARAVAAARWQARRREIRVLHDTVLSTLSLVAQGGAGVDLEGLRADCRAQARLLRDADLRAAAIGVSIGTSIGPAIGVSIGPAIGAAAGDATGSAGAAGEPDPLDQVRRRWMTRSIDVRVFGADPARALTGVAPAAAEALLAALEECLENVRRHSGVEVATVSVLHTGTQVQCTVTDEGCGFDAFDPASRRIGLADSVVARVEEAGGGARVWSLPGRGTSVALWVPALLPVSGAEQRPRSA